MTCGNEKLICYIRYGTVGRSFADRTPTDDLRHSLRASRVIRLPERGGNDGQFPSRQTLRAGGEQATVVLLDHQVPDTCAAVVVEQYVRSRSTVLSKGYMFPVVSNHKPSTTVEGDVVLTP